MDYAVFGPDGNLRRWGSSQGAIDDAALADAAAGEIIVHQACVPGRHYYSNGVQAYTAEQAQAQAARPAFPAVWSNVEMRWVDQRSLQDARLDAITKLKTNRDAAIAGGFTWDGSAFDADETSQARLLGLFVSSQSPTYEPVNWRLADNTWRTLSASDAAEVWTALQSHVRACFATFASLEQAANGAASAAELDAIQWPA